MNAGIAVTYRPGHCKMLELQINKFVDPAFYTDHDDIYIYKINEKEAVKFVFIYLTH